MPNEIQKITTDFTPIGVDKLQAGFDVLEKGNAIVEKLNKKKVTIDTDDATKKFFSLGEATEKATEKVIKKIDEVNKKKLTLEITNPESDFKKIEKQTDTLINNVKKKIGSFKIPAFSGQFGANDSNNKADAIIAKATSLDPLAPFDESLDRLAEKFPKEFAKLQKDIGNTTDATKILGRQIDFVENNIGKLQLRPEEINKVNSSVKAAKTQLDGFGETVKKTTAQGSGLRGQLIKIQDDMTKLALAGKHNTQEFRDLQVQAEKLSHAILETRGSVKGLASETANLDAGIGAVRGLVAGYEVYAAALGIAGGKNEEFEKTLLKINGAMALLQALQEFQELLSTRSVLRLKVETLARRAYNFVLGTSVKETQKNIVTKEAEIVATDGQVVATEAATVATTGLSLSMKVLRGALLLSGIGILVIALGYVVKLTNEFIEGLVSEEEKLRKSKAASEELTKSYVARLNAQQELAKLRNGGEKDLESEIDLMKKQGKSIDEIFRKEDELRQLQKIAAGERIRSIIGLSTYEADVSRVTYKRLKEEREKDAEDIKKNYGKVGQYLKFLFGGRESPILPTFVNNDEFEKEIAEAKLHANDIVKEKIAADLAYQKDRKARALEFRSLEASLFAKSGEDYTRLVTAKINAAKVGYEKDILNYDDSQKKILTPIRYRIYLKEVEDILIEWRRRNDKQLNLLSSITDQNKTQSDIASQAAQGFAESITNNFSQSFKKLSPKQKDQFNNILKDIFLGNIDEKNLFKKATDEDVKNIFEGTKITLAALEESRNAKTDFARQEQSDIEDTNISLIKDSWLRQKAEIIKLYNDEVKLIENSESQRKQELLDLAKKRRDNELGGDGILSSIFKLDKGQEELALKFLNSQFDLYKSIADFKVEQDNREIKSQEDKISRFKELAETGSAELLQLEEDRLEKLKQRREEDVENQRTLAAVQLTINSALAISEGIVATIAAFNPLNGGNLLTGILTAAALAATVASSIVGITQAFSSVPAFAKGTEYLTGNAKSDGGMLIEAHEGERIVPKDKNKKLKGISNNELSELASIGKLVRDAGLNNFAQLGMLANSTPDLSFAQAPAKDYTKHYMAFESKMDKLIGRVDNMQTLVTITEEGIEKATRNVQERKADIVKKANL